MINDHDDQQIRRIIQIIWWLFIYLPGCRPIVRLHVVANTVANSSFVDQRLLGSAAACRLRDNSCFSHMSNRPSTFYFDIFVNKIIF